MAKPLMLDKNFPFESWGDRFVQQGREFHKYTLLEKNPGAPIIPQPKMINPRKPRTVIRWKRKYYYIQDVWLFDRGTWEAVKIRMLP